MRLGRGLGREGLPWTPTPTFTLWHRISKTFPLNWGRRTYQLGMWLNAMGSIMTQEKMSRKPGDKELQLCFKFSMPMKQSLGITTAKMFLYSLLKLKEKKK